MEFRHKTYSESSKLPGVNGIKQESDGGNKEELLELDLNMVKCELIEINAELEPEVDDTRLNREEIVDNDDDNSCDESKDLLLHYATYVSPANSSHFQVKTVNPQAMRTNRPVNNRKPLETNDRP